MTTRPCSRPKGLALAGYTLVEAILAVVILGIVGLTASYVVIGAGQIYAEAMPAMQASYQADFSAERLRRDIRGMGDRASVTVSTTTALTFDDAAGNTIAYSWAAGELLRNGDLLARGVTALRFDYWRSEGTAATTPAEIHLVGFDLTVESGGQPSRVLGVVYPRNGLTASPGGASPLDEAASAASASRASANSFDVDLVSLSSGDLVIQSFSVSSPASTEEMHRLRLEGIGIWHDHGVFLPAGTTALNLGSAAEGTIPAGSSPTLTVEFMDNQTGTVQYQLVLFFTDGSSSTLTATIAW